MMNFMDTKGFTLIELMIVIVIVGILAGVAMPRFMGAKDKSKIEVCDADLNTIRKALAFFEIDHSGYPKG